MHDNHDNADMMDPPRYDMLTVKFRGDGHTITLPYCEVANGDIQKIEEDKIIVLVTQANEDPAYPSLKEVSEAVTMTFISFKKLVEDTFDVKEITELSLQLAGSYNQVQIL